MKIAILTSGILPVPAVQGGAVENLVDFYLAYNDKHKLHDITIYSVWHPYIKQHPVQKSDVNHYVYIKVETPIAKIRKRLFHYLHKNQEFYHYTIEYFLNQALQHIRSQQYDAIIIENRPGYALRLRDRTKAPIVYHLHNEKLSKFINEHQTIYEAASKIITVSDYIANCVKTINPNDTKCFTVHNGIDLETFKKQAPMIVPSIFEDDDFIIIFSGRITKEKGVKELIEAIIKLNDYPNIKLLIIGSSFYGNTGNEDSYAKSLKTIAKNIEGQILFTGFIPYSQMPSYLQMADVAVIPSVWDDPFPTTVLEAQAMGLPIITTRRGGIPEEVTEENAIMLETDDHFVDNLAAAILDLYQHPEKRQKMAAASLKRSKLFDKESYAKNFFKALESI